jgi:D-arginine dehydrogenase
MEAQNMDVAVIGAGIAGIAAAYYLCRHGGRTKIVILDPGPPMGLTSAQSGENYRNWWPHPVMRALTDDSIGLMEEIARQTGNRIRMTRRGYALATRRAKPEDLIRQLHAGYGADAGALIRIREGRGSAGYVPPVSADWQTAPDGVDVLLDRDLIRRSFPSFDRDVATVLHIRRAGDLNGQQLGQYMLERIRDAGGRVLRARVAAIARRKRFVLECTGEGKTEHLNADILVNAAGPYVADIAEMLGESLPVETVLQQKIAFEDREGAIPRQMPFSIDLDGQAIDWTGEERAALAEDASLAWVAAPMPGGIHCRPDGGDRGRWIKLGWAYNRTPGAPVPEPALDPHFPEIVLRGASRLNPSLRRYYGRLPRQCTHYGGYYTMTPENWPLIGPMRTAGAFIVGALSGFGTMAACAAGALCARWIDGQALPAYATPLSLERYRDAALMGELAAAAKGVL